MGGGLLTGLALLLALATSATAQTPRRGERAAISRAIATVARAAASDTDSVRLPDSAAVTRADSLDPGALARSIISQADTFVRAAGDPGGFRSRSDSIASARTRIAADRSDDLRLVISLNRRRLWALVGQDTLLSAPVAVSTDETLEYAGRTWTFETPRGMRTVLGKKENPVWTPPVWHYAEVAREHGLALVELPARGPVRLNDGRWLEVRGEEVGIVDPSSHAFRPLRTDEHIVFDGTLYVPPIGTRNRRVEGELGHHMLDTGNGFLLHGTPHRASIGTAATHGCIRLRDDDIEWLYEMIPVGTKVYIY